jgi:glucosamine--fructose-6-phosphate aminotransferase (isomerizing)
VSRFRDEIGEQPELASRLLTGARDAVAAIATRFHEARPQGFVIAARGSSDHAADYARYLFGRRHRALVSLAAPSLFTHYASPPRLDGQCVIGISQSGASPDVIAVIAEASRQGAMTIAVTNSPDSPLAAAADLVLPLMAEAEESVPASKTYGASLLVLAMLSEAIAPDAALAASLRSVPNALAGALEREPDVARLAHALAGPRAVVLGRGFNLSTAEEVALKLTEAGYVLARAWSVADFVHGPIAVVDAGFPVLLVGGGGPLSGDLGAIAVRLRAYSCKVVGLFDGDSTELEEGSFVRMESGLPEELTPLTLAVLGQLLAYHVALARGVDPDVPRALSKITRTW